MAQMKTYLLITASWCVLLQNKGAGVSSDQHDRIEDHHASYSQVLPIDHDETGGKENQRKGISETCLGSKVEQRYVLVGENVTLLPNTGGQERDVAMYTESQTYVGSWHYKDGHPETKYINSSYSAEMDEKGNVGLTNAKKNYTGNYIFRCDPPCEQTCMKLNVLDNLTDEAKKITIRPHNEEVIMKNLGGSHSETDHRITAILVIVIILLIIMIIWFACYMWNQHKTSKKSLTEDQVEKGLYDLTGILEKNLENLTDDQTRALIHKFLDVYLIFVKKNLGQFDRTEVHDTSSSQVSPIVHDEELGVEKRLLEDETRGKENRKKGISETSFINIIKGTPKQADREVQTDFQLPVQHPVCPTPTIVDGILKQKNKKVQTDFQLQVWKISDSAPVQISDETNCQLSTGVKSSETNKILRPRAKSDKETMQASSHWEMENNKWQKQRVEKDKLDVDEDCGDDGSVDFSKQPLLEESGQKA